VNTFFGARRGVSAADHLVAEKALSPSPRDLQEALGVALDLALDSALKLRDVVFFRAAKLGGSYIR
jgi:hypothetical protein